MEFNNLDLIRKKSRNWTLEGDCLFLDLMNNISKQLEGRSEECLKNLSEMANNLENTYIALENTTNKLSALQNTQFIENRVYDDDETMPILKTDVPVDRKKCNNYNPIQTLDTILNNNLKMMVKYHEKVSLDLNESDEEDVDRNKNTIYRSKTLYEMHPLPYIFWTKNWREKSHVGICDSDEDFSNGETEEYSDSDDNISLPSKTVTISESGSSFTGLLPSNHAHPTFSSSEDNSVLITSSHDFEKYYIHKPKLQSNEISNADLEETIPKTNVSKKINSQRIPNIFNDEPPELDEADNTSNQLQFSKNKFYEKTKHSNTKKINNFAFPEPNQDEEIQYKNMQTINNFNKKNVNLFDDDDQEDDFEKLFNVLSRNPKKKSLPVETNNSKNLFDSDEGIPPSNKSMEVSSKIHNSIVSKNILLSNSSSKNEVLTPIYLFEEKPVDAILKDSSLEVNVNKHSEDYLSDQLPIITTEKKKYSLNLFDEEPPEDEFDILFNSALNSNKTFNQNSDPTKIKLTSELSANKNAHINDSSKFIKKYASKERPKSNFQRNKLFDSESEDEIMPTLRNDTFSKPKLENTEVTTANKSKFFVSGNQEIIKQSNKLFHPDSEAKEFDANANEDDIFKTFKNDDLAEASAISSNLSPDELIGEKVRGENNNLNSVFNDLEPSEEQAGAKSMGNNIFVKSKSRVDKLFDSGSEEETTANKSKKVILDNQKIIKQSDKLFDSDTEEKEFDANANEDDLFKTFKNDDLAQASKISSNLSPDELIGEKVRGENNNLNSVFNDLEPSEEQAASKSMGANIFVKSKSRVDKLFDSGSEEESTANKSKKVILDNKKIIKQSDKLFDSDSEEKENDGNANENYLFKMLKKDDLAQVSKISTILSTEELIRERVHEENNNINSVFNDLESSARPVPGTSALKVVAKSTSDHNFVKSKSRVDKLFDSESEGESTANISKMLVSDNQKIKNKSDKLFDLDSEEKENDPNEDDLFKILKKDDLTQASKISTNLSHDELLGERVHEENNYINSVLNDLETSAGPVPGTSALKVVGKSTGDHNLLKSKSRVDKLFDSESEDESTANKSKKVISDNQKIINQSDKLFASDSEQKECKANSTTKQATNPNSTYSSDHPIDDFFSLHKKENNMDKPNINLTSSQSQSGGFVPIGLFEDIPPDDDNEVLLVTNQTKRTHSIFYDDFADTIPTAISSKESLHYSYNIFDDEPPPDTRIEKFISPTEKKENTCNTVTNCQTIEKNKSKNEIMKFPDISARIKKAERSENEIDSNNTSTKLPTPKKLSKTKLNINVHALMGGANIKALQNAKKNQSSCDNTKDKEELNTTDIEEKNPTEIGTNTGEVPTLAHLNKHRAKLPVSRRPSTRHGRQENYKKFVSNHAELGHKSKGSSLKNQNKYNVAKGVSLDKKTPGAVYPVSLKSAPVSKFASNEDIFNQPIADDDLFINSKIYKSKMPIKKLQPSNTSTRLFSSDDDDDDDDENLFTRHSLQKLKKLDTAKADLKQYNKTLVTQKSGLFDDDSDDDLFQISDKKLKLYKNKNQNLPKISLSLKVDDSKSSDNPLADLLFE